ncbi:phosphate metabolism protein 7 [Dipsacomyces acuminosporus]|nr:phosphate metabolism protein 7 [Dipsacomyces acuminosporus]
MADSSDTANTSNSVRPFVSSLVFNVALAAGFIVAFSILRPHFKRVYAPRTYAVEKGKRSPVIGSAFFAWIPAILKVPDEKIIQRTGLDTYMFLRSMRSMFIMFTVLGLLSAITILPANITGGNNNEGLSRLSMGNIKPESKKLWVHIVFFMIFVAWVVWNIFKELSVYIKLRMWWLTNQEHTNKVGSSTILVSSLPDNLVDKDDKLEGIFNVFPGGTKQIIVNRNVSELEAVVKDRDAKALKLEGLLTKYAVQCEQAYNKSVKKGGAYKEPKRPTMRESKIPFKGPKVDAITYLSTEIAKLNNQIDEMTEDLSKYKRQSSAFVLFNKQIAAHMSAQTVLDYKPFSMNSVSLDVYPEDIIWSNLNMNPYDRRIRSYISFAGTVGLTVVWTLLTAFLATLVQVKKLRTLGPFKNIPEDSKIMDIFSGIIPSVILAVLMALLPIILRLLLRLEGTPRTSEIELKLLGRFFFFQVWNVYLVTIFSSSILSIMAKSIGNPGEIVKQIEKSVPESATNILVYVLLLAFTGAAKEVLQMVPLFLRYILPKLFAKTPRAIINSLKPKDFDWGTSIPVHTLMFLMGFSYSFIAPIVNWFVAIYFALFYLVYRYQFLYVYNDANWCTGGLSFPKTVKQMFVGIYISEVYMLLMMVAKLKNEANPIIRVVFTALILLFTIGAHIYINDAYMPVINYLPIKRAMEVDQDPTLTTKLPDELVPQDEDLTPEQKIRKKIYAMYGSIIPVKLIDFILKKIPSILVKLTKLSKESDSSGNVADLADEEELRTIQIICEGTAINEKCTVTADTDFDLDEREADNRDEMQNINLSLRGTRTTLPINDTP